MTKKHPQTNNGDIANNKLWFSNQKYVSNPDCNKQITKAQVFGKKNTRYTTKSCKKQYTSCHPGYYMDNSQCIKCPDGMYCPGGDKAGAPTEKLDCGTDYAGSLYHKLASYAYDTCVRPSKNDNKTPLPHTVLQDINVVMDQIRAGMSDELSKECERLGGTWVSTAYDTDSTVPTLSTYDKETSASKQWGYCKQ